MSKFKVGQTYKNGKGQDVRIICDDRRVQSKAPTYYPLVGLVGPNAEPETFTPDGYVNRLDPGVLDLVAPKTRVAVFQYTTRSAYGGGVIHGHQCGRIKPNETAEDVANRFMSFRKSTTRPVQIISVQTVEFDQPDLGEGE